VGLALGLALGEVLGLGEWLADAPGDLPWPRRMIVPVTPRRRITTTAMIAGIIHEGRSPGMPPPAGLRATVDWRAGARAGSGGVVT
jgi:hypothetical protein